MALMKLSAGSSGDADTGNRLVDTAGERRRGDLSEQHGNIHVTVCKVHSWWEFGE